MVKRIRFVRHAKDLGFTLKEIRKLLELRVQQESSCADVRSRVRSKIEDVERRIATLQRMTLSRVSGTDAGAAGPPASAPSSRSWTARPTPSDTG